MASQLLHPSNRDNSEDRRDHRLFRISEADRERNVTWVRVILVFAIILWIVLVICFSMYKTGIAGYIIIIIPIIAFIIAIANIDQITLELEERLFRDNYISIAVLFVLPLLIWLQCNYKRDKTTYVSIITIALIFALISLLDFWVGPRYISIVNHIKSIFQTYAVVLIIYAFYAYYLHVCDNPEQAFTSTKV